MNNTNPKILIVDDMPENINVLYEALKSEYEISAATDGKTALEITESENAPDMILLDIMMPDMNGYEVCVRLKSNPKTVNIPIIFITALGDEEDEAMGLTLGAVDYIVKPFKSDIVKVRIRTQLELKQQRDRLALEAEIAREVAEAETKAVNCQYSKKTIQEIQTQLKAIIEYSDELTDNAGKGNYDNMIPVLQKINEAGKKVLATTDRLLINGN